MTLHLYNSLSHRKEEFRPIDSQNVRMYVCGPTVYDYAHIGNARAVVVFDLLYRVLRHEYGADHVKYVRNITDVEDKIIDAARANGEPIDALTARTERIFQEDMDALGNLRPDVQPRATEHIPQMIAMIDKLIASGHAYAAQGHALFRVAAFKEYGKLSRRSRKEMIAGARVEIAPYKEDPGDFVLWKPSDADQPGWDSPWGRGRPGWHIECSAMSETHLGTHFDIHGGGIDLVFPHHENEIAQSECAHGGEPFVNFWVHNGFLSVDSAKMSKSLGNFITARDALAKAPGEIVRLALLMTHYREPLDWTDERLREAEGIHGRLYRALTVGGFELEDDPTVTAVETAPVAAALSDDLNSHEALTALRSLADAIYKESDEQRRKNLKAALKNGGAFLGLLEQKNLDDWLNPILEPSVELKIQERNTARKERRFADADRIRDELMAEGILLEDGPGGTTWRRA